MWASQLGSLDIEEKRRATSRVGQRCRPASSIQPPCMNRLVGTHMPRHPVAWLRCPPRPARPFFQQAPRGHPSVSVMLRAAARIVPCIDPPTITTAASRCHENVSRVPLLRRPAAVGHVPFIHSSMAQVVRAAAQRAEGLPVDVLRPPDVWSGVGWDGGHYFRVTCIELGLREELNLVIPTSELEPCAPRSWSSQRLQQLHVKAVLTKRALENPSGAARYEENDSTRYALPRILLARCKPFALCTARGSTHRYSTGGFSSGSPLCGTRESDGLCFTLCWCGPPPHGGPGAARAARTARARAERSQGDLCGMRTGVVEHRCSRDSGAPGGRFDTETAGAQPEHRSHHS